MQVSNSLSFGLPPPRPDTPADPLTYEETVFALHWARFRNAPAAAREAWGPMKTPAATERARHALGDARIQAVIRQVNQIALEEAGVSVAWLLQRFMDIATADPRELIALRVGCCRRCWGDGHRYQWREIEYAEALDRAEAAHAEAMRQGKRSDVQLPDIAGGFGYDATREPHPDCPMCHGEGQERIVARDTERLSPEAALLYGGVKTRQSGGYEIVMADRMKALEMVGKIMGAFTDNLNVDANVKTIAAVADLRSVDAQTASRAYQDMIAKGLTAPSKAG